MAQQQVYESGPMNLSRSDIENKGRLIQGIRMYNNALNDPYILFKNGKPQLGKYGDLQERKTEQGVLVSEKYASNRILFAILLLLLCGHL